MPEKAGKPTGQWTFRGVPEPCFQVNAKSCTPELTAPSDAVKTPLPKTPGLCARDRVNGAWKTDGEYEIREENGAQDRRAD